MKHRLLLFTLLLIAVELYQYRMISDTRFITGDFSIDLTRPEVVPWALFLSVTHWIGAYLLEKLTPGSGKPRLVIPDSNWILLIFVANLAITAFADVGHVMRVSTSSLSILTTLVPINYLILVMGSQRIGLRFYIACALFVATDLYRLLLGTVFKLFYIYIVRAKRLVLTSLLLCPLAYFAVGQLTAYKFESRQMALPDSGNPALETVTRRISSTPTFAYGLQAADDLAYFCHREPYASQYTAALLSVLPKRMFGVEFVKTYNNCLIEYRIGNSVQDSSVNSPWLLNIILLAKSSGVQLAGYLFLTLSLLTLITVTANFLFGAQAGLLKYWIYFEFLWTGNILHLTIPAYFLVMLAAVYRLQQPITARRPVLAP